MCSRTAALAAVEAGRPPDFLFGGGLLARRLAGSARSQIDAGHLSAMIATAAARLARGGGR